MLRVQRHRQRRMQVLLWTRLQRLQVRRLVPLWCIREVVSVRLLQQRSMLLETLVDRRMRSLVLVRLRERQPTHDTEASTRAEVRVIAVLVVWVLDRWSTTQAAWVLTRRPRVALRVRLARRLAGVRCGEVRARRMRPRRQGLLRVQLWWHRVDWWRMHHQLRRRHRMQLVLAMMRRRRLQERRQVVLCCLVVAARRRRVVLRAMVLVVKVGRLNRRVLPLVRWCLVVVDQRRRRVQRLARRHDLEVAASVRCSRQQAKRLARQ